MGKFLDTFTSGLAGGLSDVASGGISQIVSGGIQGLGKLFGLGGMSEEEAMQKQHEYNKEIMAIQNQYQTEAAKQSQQYAKEYWDYTNAENQARHLKSTGLNIGLMYGQSGAGGMGASGGAKQDSPSQPQNSPVAMGLQVQALQQQKRLQDAEIAKTFAEARKAEAEAEKTAGVDTQKTLVDIEERLSQIDLNLKQGDWYKADEEYKKALTDYTKSLKGLTIAQTATEEERKKLIQEYVRTEIEKQAKLAEEWQVLHEEAIRLRIANYVADQSKEDMIEQVSLQNAQIVANIALAESQVEVNDKTIEKMGAEMEELYARADKHNWDKQTYRKEVEGLVQRWNDQTTNERWHLANESVSTIVDGITSFMPWKIGKTTTKSVKDGVMTTTEKGTKSRF